MVSGQSHGDPGKAEVQRGKPRGTADEQHHRNSPCKEKCSDGECRPESAADRQTRCHESSADRTHGMSQPGKNKAGRRKQVDGPLETFHGRGIQTRRDGDQQGAQSNQQAVDETAQEQSGDDGEDVAGERFQGQTTAIGRVGRPGVSEELQQVDHFDGCVRGFLTLVAGFAAGAVECLFEGFAGDDAEGDRDITADAGLKNS